MRRLSGGAAGLLVAALVLVGIGSPSSAATNKASAKSPIVIGYISDLTGFASSTFADGPGGAQAVIDEANAAGGIDGHKLKLIVKDDQSSPASNLTAAQVLVGDGATVIIEYSSFAFGATTYLQKQGIPVLGSAFDGPEWALPANSNMFTWSIPAESPINGQSYTYTNLGKFLKDLGATSFGGLGYGISPSSSDSILAAEKSAAAFGIKTCYTNNTVPFGAVAFTTDVLAIKSSNCGSVAGSFVEASDLALSTAMRQGGLGATKQVYFTGYDQTTISTATNRAGFNGDYVDAGVNFSPPNAAGTALLATLKKYDPTYSGGVPDFGLLGSSISAQLAVYGLKLDGSNPTSATFISKLRQVGNFNDGGLLPTPISFQHFGTLGMFPKTDCIYFEQLKGSKWVEYSGKPICGTRVAYNT